MASDEKKRLAGSLSAQNPRVLRDIASQLGIEGANYTDLSSGSTAVRNQFVGSGGDKGRLKLTGNGGLIQKLNEELAHAGPETVRQLRMQTEFSPELAVNDTLGSGRPHVSASPVAKEGTVVGDSQNATSRLRNLVNQISNTVSPVLRNLTGFGGPTGAVAQRVVGDGTQDFQTSPLAKIIGMLLPGINAEGVDRGINDTVKAVKRFDAGDAGTMEDVFIKGALQDPALKSIFGDSLESIVRDPTKRKELIGGLNTQVDAPTVGKAKRKITIRPDGSLVEVKG